MPPKKGKKMALDEFLMDASTGGSWADEMDALPTGPSGDPSRGSGELGGSHLSRNARGGGDRMDRDGGRGGFGGRDRDEDRPPRAEVPIPTAPPYTAFVGNLAFDTTEGDLESFFQPLRATSVRLVSGYDLKPKGFGYVEFSTVDDLKTALSLTGNDMSGRTVRISVAEPPKNREGRADEEVSWVRSGPLAPLPGRSGGGFGSGGDRGGFERGSSRMGPGEGGEEREREGPIRGGKFVPSGPEAPRRSQGGFDRSTSGSYSGGGGGGERGGERNFERAPVVEEKERDGPIRGGKFVPSAPATPSSGSSFERRAVSGSATSGGGEEKSWTRSGPLPPLVGAGGRSASGGFGSDRGPRAFGDRTPPTESSAPPQQRQRLQLSARSTPAASPTVSPSNSSTSVPTTASTKPSPFGAAKPVDVAAREREVEAKLAKEKQEIKEKLEKERSEKREKEKEEVKEKEKDREEKLAKARFGGGEKEKEKEDEKEKVTSPTPAPATTPAATNAPKPAAALRKEGFSYSSIANNSKTEEQVAKGTKDPEDAAAEVAQKLAEVSV